MEGGLLLKQEKDWENTGSLTERMRVASNGNVRIGTTNPGDKLTVNGNITIQGPPDGSSTVDDGYKLRWVRELDNPSNNIAEIYCHDHNGPFVISAPRGGGEIKLSANPSFDHQAIAIFEHSVDGEKMRISESWQRRHWH